MKLNLKIWRLSRDRSIIVSWYCMNRIFRRISFLSSRQMRIRRGRTILPISHHGGITTSKSDWSTQHTTMIPRLLPELLSISRLCTHLAVTTKKCKGKLKSELRGREGGGCGGGGVVWCGSGWMSALEPAYVHIAFLPPFYNMPPNTHTHTHRFYLSSLAKSQVKRSIVISLCLAQK